MGLSFSRSLRTRSSCPEGFKGDLVPLALTLTLTLTLSIYLCIYPRRSGGRGSKKGVIFLVKRFPPFCVHFYPRSFCDFPICSPSFETYESALKYAATHYPGYLFRIGYWFPEKYPDRYFHLEEVDVQCSLFDL